MVAKPWFGPDAPPVTGTPASKRAEAVPDAEVASHQLRLALKKQKRSGMVLAYRARMASLVLIALFLPFIVPWPNLLYPEALLVAFMLVSWLQLQAGRVERSRVELFLVFCDYLLLTLLVVVPNPFAPVAPPAPVPYRFGTFIYFFIFLAAATISMNWRTLATITGGAPLIWLAGAVLVWLTFTPTMDFASMAALVNNDGNLFAVLDPNSMSWDVRVQEVVAFAIVGSILVLNSRRNEQLLERFANSERRRANLSRYFSPNVVEELAVLDDPLGRTQVLPASVLFIDIVGFTSYAASASPAEAMDTLRAFVARMEAVIFAHSGTLDKYLGDGLMATFGTPTMSATDALNCVRCARAMLTTVDAWNAERKAAGAAPIHVGIGAHHGEVILGNIGINRLEFAVIGDTVNVASRLEALTRALGVRLAISQALFQKARGEAPANEPALIDFVAQGMQAINGRAEAVDVVTLSDRAGAVNP